MIDPPKTLEEAKKHRYGQWAGNERGYPYRPDQCAYSVQYHWTQCQCSRANGYGPEGLYCKQHSKKLPKPPLVIELDPPLRDDEFQAWHDDPGYY